MTKVLVAGFDGSMGQKVVNLVNNSSDLEIDAAYAPEAKNDPAQYNLDSNVKIFTSLDDIDTDAEVWIDFTLPASVYENTKFAIQHGIRPVIGTSGLTDDQTKELKDLAEDKKLGGIVAPNFGLSAVLLMKFAQEAASYFNDGEVIEMHHGDKKDAPSGTALNTAKLMDQNRPHPGQEVNPSEEETLRGSRGGDYNGIKVHSVRLPGYVAHEQVLFGGEGEALTIRQDSFDRKSFMKGVKLATDKVGQLDHLVVGLENIL